VKKIELWRFKEVNTSFLDLTVRRRRNLDTNQTPLLVSALALRHLLMSTFLYPRAEKKQIKH